MKKQSPLLEKTFEKGNCYNEIAGVKVFHFDFVHVAINTDDSKIVYTINRSHSSNGYHYISRNFKINTEREYKETKKLYTDEKAFENAILRIEKLTKQKA